MRNIYDIQYYFVISTKLIITKKVVIMNTFTSSFVPAACHKLHESVKTVLFIIASLI